MTKKLLIATYGTRGDVEPFVNLGKGLHLNGWEVAIATHLNFQALVSEAKLKFFCLPGDPTAIMTSADMKAALTSGSQTQLMKVMKKETDLIFNEMMAKIYEAACEFRPGILLGTIVLVAETASIAQKLRLPAFICGTIPTFPTRQHAPVGLPSASYGGSVNKGLYSLLAKVQWSILGKKHNDLREKLLSLPPLNAMPFDNMPYLYIYSNVVQPKPSDWPDFAQVTGYLLDKNPPEYDPPVDLASFLSGGDAPIYIGFGSMPVTNEKILIDGIRNLIKELGCRVLLCAGWSQIADDFSDMGASFMMIPGAPHHWLFPRCKAIVHHGGAGTTAAALNAGVPQVIFHVLVDQPFWASRITSLGVGPPKSYPLRELSQQNLVSQVAAVLKPTVVEMAKEVGDLIRKEDGVEQASKIIKQYYDAFSNDLPPLEWESNNSVQNCGKCSKKFWFFKRKHHCRHCGRIHCRDCLSFHPLINYNAPVLMCEGCWDQTKANVNVLPLPGQVVIKENLDADERAARNTIIADEDLAKMVPVGGLKAAEDEEKKEEENEEEGKVQEEKVHEKPIEQQQEEKPIEEQEEEKPIEQQEEEKPIEQQEEEKPIEQQEEEKPIEQQEEEKPIEQQQEEKPIEQQEEEKPIEQQEEEKPIEQQEEEKPIEQQEEEKPIEQQQEEEKQQEEKPVKQEEHNEQQPVHATVEESPSKRIEGVHV